MTILWAIGIVLFICFGFIVAVGSPYVPSRRRDIQRALDELYEISPKDTLLDLGSGDGVVLRAAAAKGAKAYGVELNPLLVFISRLISVGNTRIQTSFGDIHSTAFPPETTIVYIFANTKDISRLTKKCEKEAHRLKRQLHVISYGAEFPKLQAVQSLGAYHLYRTASLQ